MNPCTQEYLDLLYAARVRLITGGQVEVVRYADRSVTYTRADSKLLLAEIARVEECLSAKAGFRQRRLWRVQHSKGLR